MRQIIAAKLIILAMATTIAVLICIIGYGIFFSPNGIFTMLAKTRDWLSNRSRNINKDG